MKFTRQDLQLKDGRKLYVYSFQENNNEKQKSIWNKVAKEWQKNARQIEQWMQPVTEVLIQKLPQGIIVDLGCGAATLCLPHQTKVIGIDIAPNMFQAGTTAIAATLEQLPLKSNICDAAISRMALMLTQNPQQVFKETHRILKNKAVFNFAVWQKKEKNAWIQIPQQILLNMLQIQLPQNDQPGAFRLSNSNEVRILLKNAGFQKTTRTRVTLHFFQKIGPQKTWQFVKTHIAPISVAFHKLNKQQQLSAQKQILQAYNNADLLAHADVWHTQKLGYN